MSSASILCAVTQDKGLQYVDMKESKFQKGKMYNAFKVVFGGLESTGDLSNPKTLIGNKFKSKVIEAFQSASVDNEKEQILYKLNINKHTFATINALAMLGFEENIIAYFINQPIIEMYVDKMADKDSSLREFTPDMNKDVVDSLIEEIGKKYNVVLSSDNVNLEDIGIESTGNSIGLKELLETDESLRTQRFWEHQIRVLSKFKKLNEVGQDLQGLMQTINAKSKGAGKTLFATIAREDKINRLDDVNQGVSKRGIRNAEKTLYDEDGSPNTLSGFVSDYMIRELNRVGDKLFPYKATTLSEVFDKLAGVMNVSNRSVSAIEDFKATAFTSLKSFIFSRSKVLGIENAEELDAKRNRLFIDE